MAIDPPATWHVVFEIDCGPGLPTWLETFHATFGDPMSFSLPGRPIGIRVKAVHVSCCHQCSDGADVRAALLAARGQRVWWSLRLKARDYSDVRIRRQRGDIISSGPEYVIRFDRAFWQRLPKEAR